MLALWVCGNGWRCAACAEEEQPPADAMVAALALDRVEDLRVTHWRAQHGLTLDSDFAFHFIEFDQAVSAAGRAVAQAWLEARHAAMGHMLHDVDQALQEVERAAPSATRSLRVKPTARKRPLRLRENTVSSPAAVQRRVEALCQVWINAGALRPTGMVSREILASWEKSCLRLAQKHVAHAEPVTVNNAVATFRELQSSLQHRGRGFPPQAVDIDFFLHEYTAAPARSFNSLKWLTKQGSLDWPLSHVSVPSSGRGRKKKGPAAVVTPSMLARLEEAIEQRYDLGDPEWTCLLAAWLIGVGVLRHKHLTRSSPRKLTKSFAHFHCSKGKQRQNRGGFDFAVPSTFGSGWPWGERWLEFWKSLPEEVRQAGGICMDAAGQSWPLGDVQRLTQILFHQELESTEELTSYSWRRLFPTVAHILKLPPEAGLALGDWQDKAQDRNSMPLHYSSVRYLESLKVKARCLGALQTFQRFEAWEQVPEEALEEAAAMGGRYVQQLLPRDGHVIWAKPLGPKDAAAMIAASHQLKARSIMMRHRAARDAASMPKAVNGKQVSAFLRDSTLLCGPFQEGKCSRSSHECAAHQCAVIFPSGRVCGGKHAARDCRDKRFIAVVEQTDEPVVVSESASPSSRPATPKLKPTSKKRPAPSRSPDREEPSKVVRRSQPSAPSSVVPIPPLPLDQEAEVKFDRLATTKGRSAQAPTAIFRSNAGGVLWLAGLPTAKTAAQFPRVALQIQCFHEELSRRGGVQLESTLHMTVCPTDTRSRTAQWRVAWPCMKQSLFAGDSVLLHCIMAGRHRAAAIGVLSRALLAKETIPEANTHIMKSRDIELHKIAYDRGVGTWLKEMMGQATVGSPLPTINGFLATGRSHLHLRTEEGAPLCAHKQGGAKAADRLSYPMQSTEMHVALAWGRPQCQACLGRAPASWQVRLRDA